MALQLDGRPALFGEVLFDRFPDGSVVLGGAPFNVAWHLQGFGLQPLFISRVGNDDLGQQVRRAMSDWGMDQAGLQTDMQRPTGTVRVTLEDKQPRFEIEPNRAYDHIDADAAVQAVAATKTSLLYCGSLVARSGTSREALLKLRSQSQLPVYLDVNLRPPWWDHALLWQLLRGARWVKVNEFEIRLLTEDPIQADASTEILARNLRAKFNFELIIATLGDVGAFFITPNESKFVKAVPANPMVDSVGAGDAFSAVTILGLLKQWPLEILQQRAAEFASVICGTRGATTKDRGLYDKYRQSWNL